MFLWPRSKVLCGALLLLLLSLLLIWRFNGFKAAVTPTFEEVEIIDDRRFWLKSVRKINSTSHDGDKTTCSCVRKLETRDPSEDLSTCSREATTRGHHQRVLAFSFYGNIRQQKRNYFQGIENNALLVGHLYPGWTMRVYHDMDPNSHEICSLYCMYPFLDFCNARSIPRLGNVINRQQNAWRFLPMCDPTVDVFVSRDLDSLISERERAAVDQWLQSNLTYHVMRDHMHHSKVVMGGMWGAKLTNNRDNLTRLCTEMMAEENGKKGKDQEMLQKYLWEAMKDDVLQHDSYKCKQFRSHGHMEAWPTRRLVTPHNFVGARIEVDRVPIKEPCPAECRPVEHKDWTTC